MPRFTIGIPTYNRADYLKRSLGCAVAQSCSDLEIIVADDASTDHTEEVVRSFGDRVRYHRNEPNIGMWPNFLKIAELSQSDYFSWIQDDDLLHCDFARRAVEAFETYDDIAMYTAYSVDTHSAETFVLPIIIGPPIAMDWMNSKVRVLDGSIVLPISFFLTFSMPPITAYRTDLVRQVTKEIDPTDILYNERILQSKVVADGKIAVDPYLGGIFFKHENQGSVLGGSCDIPERSRQWVIMVNKLSRMLEGRSSDEWKPQLDAWLESVSNFDLLAIYGQIAPLNYWSELRPIALEICSRYLDFLPEPFRRAHFEAMNSKVTTRTIVKDFGKQLTPPLVWNFLKSMKRQVR